MYVDVLFNKHSYKVPSLIEYESHNVRLTSEVYLLLMMVLNTNGVTKFFS